MRKPDLEEEKSDMDIKKKKRNFAGRANKEEEEGTEDYYGGKRRKVDDINEINTIMFPTNNEERVNEEEQF